MDIKHVGSISTVQSVASEEAKVKREKAATEERKDQLQLSGEAKELMESKKNAKIELMKARVESGYYLSDEVTEKTAEKIMKAL